MYNVNSQFKFKTTMLKLSLCVITVMHLQFVKGTISGANTEKAGATSNKNYEKEIFKNPPSFTDYISQVNNTQVDNVRDVNVVMLICTY